MKSFKTYNELIQFSTFEDRFNYLKLSGNVGEDTFGFDRYLNQNFYRSAEWKRFRKDIIIRDNGCDLGISDRPIFGKIFLHHITPITPEDIIDSTECLLDPNNVICMSFETHNALHYGTKNPEPIFTERSKNDTCPWRN